MGRPQGNVSGGESRGTGLSFVGNRWVGGNEDAWNRAARDDNHWFSSAVWTSQCYGVRLGTIPEFCRPTHESSLNRVPGACCGFPRPGVVKLLNLRRVSATLTQSSMATPCRKCGATKTERVRHGLMYSIARKCGYRLRLCSRCRRRRLIPLGDDPDEPVAPRKRRFRGVLQIYPAPVSIRDGKVILKCPCCGGSELQRSKRRLHERVLKRPPMLKCRACQNRFPLLFI